MSDPIKAAAERWRRLANGERGKVVYGFAKTEDEQLDECDYDLVDKARNRDAKILADAYLALGERLADRWTHQRAFDGALSMFTFETPQAAANYFHAEKDGRIVRVSTFIREEEPTP